MVMVKRNIFIIDDHELVRKGLRQIINSEDDLQVFCEASSVSQVIQLKQTIKPDIAIVDISLPDGSGLDLIKNLHQWRPSLKIVVLSMYEDELYAERALNNGAMGYVNKQDSADNILTAIRQVLNDKIYVSPKITETLLKRFSNKTSTPSLIGSLSDREIQVFELIGDAKKTSEIAEMLHLSVKTIDTYRSNIKQKLNLSSAAELNRAAVLWSLENH